MRTDPEVSHIAELFKKVYDEPEFHNKYRTLFFAILERRKIGDKFKPFYDIFGKI